jgi:aminoglycoside 6'-N-acetyltransferase
VVTTQQNEFAFRELERSDIPLVTEWLAREHVSAWWDEPPNVEQQYFGEDPVSAFIAELDGRPVGMVQRYRWANYPTEATAVDARPGEAGVDYFIGEPELTGQGFGRAMLSAFLSQLVFSEHDVSGVRVDVDIENKRSWRCLERLGFEREGNARQLAGNPRPHYVYFITRSVYEAA